MPRRRITRLGLIAAVALAFSLSGCGNSKKGNGYSYAPLTHTAVVTSGRAFAE
jgi:hypothetical protein